MLLLLSSGLLLAAVHGEPTKPPGMSTKPSGMYPECCAEKTVGGVRYTLIGSDPSGLTKELKCISPCVFLQEGNPKTKFCFGHGDLEVECQDDMEITPTPPPTGPEGAGDDEVTKLVKSLIDQDTCANVTYAAYSTTNGKCGDLGTSYYREFEYKGKRVLVSNNMPDHPAEHDALIPFAIMRCEGWHYAQLEMEPVLDLSSPSDTRLGPIGQAVTGAYFFNHKQLGVVLAVPAEGQSGDSCGGHSAATDNTAPPEVGEPPVAGYYHYHSTPGCPDAGAATGAGDPSQCKHIGYFWDGVPVYGYCQDSAGKGMTSCYKLNAGAETVDMPTAYGTFNGIGQFTTDYTYTPGADCNLDSASGAVHPTTGKYSYFMTAGYPWTPMMYMAKPSRLCGIASLM